MVFLVSGQSELNTCL